MHVVASLGEILTDRFPDYEKPGGAPCNVAYNLSVLGHQAHLVSATGRDDSAEKLRGFLRLHGISEKHVQYSDKPTGVVDVEFKGDEARYTIRKNSAWDEIRWTPELAELAPKAEAVCFSTLSRRSKVSDATISSFLDSVGENCIRILDANLRPPWYSAEVLKRSFKQADVVKLNEFEYMDTAELLETDSLHRMLFEEYGVGMLIITLGKKGSRLISPKEDSFYPVLPADVTQGDSVGVGDAFISCVTHHLLKKTPHREMMRKANLFAAAVASRKGAIVSFPKQLIDSVL